MLYFSNMINKYKSTLFECADSLIKKQIHHNHSSVNGGFLCPSCKLIHGRSIDAIYAFAICYKLTKDSKYLNAINALLDYANNLICDDGGMYNDMQALWRYTTVFQETCLCETYLSCKKVLKSDIFYLVILTKEKIIDEKYKESTFGLSYFFAFSWLW